MSGLKLIIGSNGLRILDGEKTSEVLNGSESWPAMVSVENYELVLRDTTYGDKNTLSRVNVVSECGSISRVFDVTWNDETPASPQLDSPQLDSPQLDSPQLDSPQLDSPQSENKPRFVVKEGADKYFIVDNNHNDKIILQINKLQDGFDIVSKVDYSKNGCAYLQFLESKILKDGTLKMFTDKTNGISTPLRTKYSCNLTKNGMAPGISSIEAYRPSDKGGGSKQFQIECFEAIPASVSSTMAMVKTAPLENKDTDTIEELRRQLDLARAHIASLTQENSSLTQENTRLLKAHQSTTMHPKLTECHHCSEPWFKGHNCKGSVTKSKGAVIECNRCGVKHTGTRREHDLKVCTKPLIPSSYKK